METRPLFVPFSSDPTSESTRLRMVTRNRSWVQSSPTNVVNFSIPVAL